MYKIVRTDDFNKQLLKLPKRIGVLCEKQLDILSVNWRDSRLHTKKLKGLDSVFSFRVTREYRALFYFSDSSIIVLFTAEHRKDVYRI